MKSVRGCCRKTCIESKRPDPLISDPFGFFRRSSIRSEFHESTILLGKSLKPLVSYLPLPPKSKAFGHGTFVTGHARSGTTFIGEAFSQSLRIAYTHEPFSSVGIDGVDWNKVRFDEESLSPLGTAVTEAIENLLRLKIEQPNNINPDEPLIRKLIKHVLGSRGPFHLALNKLNTFNNHLLIKDPVGLSFAPYFQRSYSFNVIVVVKHPVSNWESYARLGWPVFVPDILRTKAFTQFYDDQEKKLLAKASTELSTHERFALIWRLTYRFLLSAVERNDRAEFVTIESISNFPEQLESIANRLCIPWGKNNTRWLNSHTKVAGKAEASSAVLQDLRRDSSKIFQHRISSVPRKIRFEIEQIAQPIARVFYTDSLLDEIQAIDDGSG